MARPSTSTGAALSPEALAFAKQHLIDLVLSGRALTVALAQMGFTWYQYGKLRRDDSVWAGQIEAALAERKAHGMPYYSDDDIAHLKPHIVHLVAEEGHTLSSALNECGVGWTSVGKWRKSDLSFDQDIKDAIEFCTEFHADRLKNLHEDIQDARVAKVASDNLKTWIEWRNKKFAPKSPAEESNTQLADIIRGALTRLIDDRKQRLALAPPIDAEATPVERLTFREDP